MTDLRSLILALMSAIHPTAPQWADADRIGDAIEHALLEDARDREPLTGSLEGDAALMVEWAYRESSFRARAVGDGGKSFGAWQLQGVPVDVAFDPARAAVLWLDRAHRVWCAANVAGAELAALASGACNRGTRVVRFRDADAKHLLAIVSP